MAACQLSRQGRYFRVRDCELAREAVERPRWFGKMRQRDGIALATKEGKYPGRKPSLTAAQAADLRKRAKARERKAALACEFDIRRETLNQYIR